MAQDSASNSSGRDGASQRGEVLVALRRPDRTELRVVLDDFNGHPFLTARVWWLAPEGEMRPTQKGITVRPAEIEDFAAAVEAARRVLGGPATP